MGDIKFLCKSEMDLFFEVARPFEKVALGFAQHGRPISISLCRKDGSALVVNSTSYDIASRVEVGGLCFKLEEKYEKANNGVAFGFDFHGGKGVSKYLICEDGVVVECGVQFTCEEQELIVLAGVNPYTLAIRGVVQGPHFFEPEYPLSQYRVEPF